MPSQSIPDKNTMSMIAKMDRLKKLVGKFECNSKKVEHTHDIRKLLEQLMWQTLR